MGLTEKQTTRAFAKDLESRAFRLETILLRRSGGTHRSTDLLEIEGDLVPLLADIRRFCWGAGPRPKLRKAKT